MVMSTMSTFAAAGLSGVCSVFDSLVSGVVLFSAQRRILLVLDWGLQGFRDFPVSARQRNPTVEEPFSSSPAVAAWASRIYAPFPLQLDSGSSHLCRGKEANC